MDCHMRRLSSAYTVFYKRVLPIVWLLLPLLSAWLLWNIPAHAQQPRWPALFPMLLIPAIGLVLFKKLIFDLVDEVWLDGEQLLVKSRGQQARIALADVVNVNTTSMTNPRRITLMLRTDSRFGRNVSFMPASPRGFASAFRPDPIAVDLIERVDALRQVRR